MLSDLQAGNTQQQNIPFAVHLKKISIYLSPNLFHYGQYTLNNTIVTFICA